MSDRPRPGGCSPRKHRGTPFNSNDDAAPDPRAQPYCLGAENMISFAFAFAISVATAPPIEIRELSEAERGEIDVFVRGDLVEEEDYIYYACLLYPYEFGDAARHVLRHAATEALARMGAAIELELELFKAVPRVNGAFYAAPTTFGALPRSDRFRAFLVLGDGSEVEAVVDSLGGMCFVRDVELEAGEFPGTVTVRWRGDGAEQISGHRRLTRRGVEIVGEATRVIL